jgi:DNA-binding response OmpR family regulator
MADIVPETGQSEARLVSWTTPVAAPEVETNHQPLVLLVEDNDDLRVYLRMVLAPTYQVIEASDGQQGLELALDYCPDLVLTDLMMPRLDGLALCRALRADLRTSHIPVVMLTAKAVLEDRLVGLEMGADDYLTKPFVPTELHLRVRNLLQRQEAVLAFFQLRFNNLSEPSPVAQPDLLPDSSQQSFLAAIYAILDQQLDQPLDVEALSRQIGMSSRNLNRKLNQLVGLSAGELASRHRLQCGVSLLKSGVSPTDVAHQLGYSRLSSFSRAYKAQFGHAPSVVNGSLESK